MRMNVIVAIILFVCMQSCTHTTPVPQYVGVYQIDVAQSKLGEYANVDSIQNLQMTIKADSTFEFSKDVPFLSSKNGKWKLEYTEPIDLPPFYKCIFDFVGNPRQEVLRPMDEDIRGCYFNSPVSKGDYKQVELLRFKRIRRH